MQSALELDTRSPIVCRVLRVRERMKLEVAPVSSLLPSEDVAVYISTSQQGYEDSSDPAHMCAGRAGYTVHAWEKLSIHPQEPFLPARPTLDRDVALPGPDEAER